MPNAEAHRRTDALLLAALALVAVAPALLPGGELYVDNAPHLLTVDALAHDVLPLDHWWTGWTDEAELGMPAVQVNGPLAWSALAGLVWAGLPAVSTYLFAIALSNVVFALGAWSLARALLPGRLAPLLAAGLATCAVADLYGIGGATGGMWPYRLANGVLLAGLAPAWRHPRVAWTAPWLAVVLTCHTFTGVIAFAWVGLLALRAAVRRQPQALALGGALVLGCGLSAAFWLPLLQSGVTDAFAPPRQWGPSWTLATLLAPVDPFQLQVYDRYRLIGGFWSVLPAVLTLVGAAAARPRLGALGRAAALALLVLVVLLAVVIPLTAWSGLGPNPWRYYAFWRVGLAFLGGAGLARLAERTGRATWVAALVLILAGGGAVGAGLAEVPRRGDPQTGVLLGQLEAVWDAVAQARPGGRVYHEDPSQDPEAPAELRTTHVGALYPVRHGGAVLGSWYGVTPVVSHPFTTSEAIFVMAATPELLASNPEWVYDRLRFFGCEALITVSRRLPQAAGADRRFELVATEGPFAGWVLREPPMPLVGVPEGAGSVEVGESHRGRVEATITSSGGEVPFRLRQTWHPWWRATLDGRDVPLRAGQTSGLVEGVAPGSGLLVLEWRDRGAAGRWFSLLALVMWALVSWQSRARANLA